MNLLPDWKRIALKSWSFRFGVLAFVLTGLETFISVYGAGWIPEWLPKWARLSIIMGIAGGAPIARLVAQRNMRDDSEK